MENTEEELKNIENEKDEQVIPNIKESELTEDMENILKKREDKYQEKEISNSNEKEKEKDFDFIRRVTVKIDHDKILNKSSLMKEIISETVDSSVGTTISWNPFLIFVDKQKNRFQNEGFNLDLTYITDRLIAMGFPSQSLDAIFRNSSDEVVKFFEKRHENAYKIYNLCKEQTYPDDIFYKQGYYPVEDHEPPTLEQLYDFCKDLDSWLNGDPKNVAGIHCMAGKGRTGCFTIAYFLYSGFIENADDAIRYFGLMRCKNGVGLKHPSQFRYIHYFEYVIKNNLLNKLSYPSAIIKGIKLHGVPNFSLFGGCYPYPKIYNCGRVYSYKEKNTIEFYKNESMIIFKGIEYDVKGDVHVIFFNKTSFGKEKMFKFWFNTLFFPDDGVMRIKKSMIDMAFKDKKNKKFPATFKIEIMSLI